MTLDTAQSNRQERAAGEVRVEASNAAVKPSAAAQTSPALDLSRFLNDSSYHFEQKADPLASLSLGGNEPVSTLTRLAASQLPKGP